MAVYKRTYQPYQGPLTPAWSRFLVIARQAHRRVFDSRFLVFFFVLCFVWPAVCAALIYLRHNAGAIELFKINVARLIPIDGQFFFRFLGWQGSMAFLLTAFVGPGLISTDLRNNALPLYFCRPFSRAEYVLGKFAVIAMLLSLITWVPGLLLFGFEANLEGGAWFRDNLWLASGIFLGSWIWIVTLCLLALALSAWVKWKVLAGALLFGVFFAAAGFGTAVNAVMHTDYGNLINLPQLVRTIWAGLFGVRSTGGIPPDSAWTALAGICALCLYLLDRKVRAFEVVRS
jgi:ABC-2 type transport system permease protein